MLYIWAYDFLKDTASYEFLTNEKEKILNSFFNNQREKIVNARKKASFGNRVGIEQIDSFFKGVDGQSGYLSKLQEAYNKYYLDSYRNAEKLFSSTINSVISNLIRYNGSLSLNFFDTYKGGKYKDNFDAMLKEQEKILDNLSLMSSKALEYAVYIGAVTGQPITKKKIENGTYKLDNLNKDLQNAIKMYNDISNFNNKVQGISVGRNGSIENSFVGIKTLANNFHVKYSEYLATMLVNGINKENKEISSKLDDTRAVLTAQSSYSFGSGVSCDVIYKEDPSLKQLFVNDNNSSLTKITSKNDTTSYIQLGNNYVSGTFGINVKSYKDSSLKKFDGWGNFEHYNNIFQAAALATKYGLPLSTGTEEYIVNLGGSLYGSYGPGGLPSKLWMEYQTFIAQLLYVDAVMGRMFNGVVNTANANNLVQVTNGKVEYIPDLLLQITQEDIRGTDKNLWATKLSEKQRYSPREGEGSPEEAHWQAFTNNETSQTAYNQIKANIQKIKFKININMSNMLKMAL